jgi:hypothetical protein
VTVYSSAEPADVRTAHATTRSIAADPALDEAQRGGSWTFATGARTTHPKRQQNCPSVARRLAAGSSRRLPTHRQDRRPRSYSALREKKCRVAARRMDRELRGERKPQTQRRPPSGNRASSASRTGQAKTPWHESVASRVRLVAKPSGLEKARADRSRRTASSGIGGGSAGHVSERELQRT